jgi:photosystem II stability/assembly factor-like uncharacterized protein
MNGTSGGAVYVSTNAGSTWTLASSGPGGYYWTWLVSSAEGSKLAAALAAEDLTATLYTSADSGASWIQATNAPVAIWTGIATSADGNKLAAVAYNGGIYTSTNSGSTWTATSAPGAKWWAIASSADGRKLAAVIYNGGIWVSTNSGATWSQTGAPTKTWAAIASAADGKKLAAAANGPTGGGPLRRLRSGKRLPLRQMAAD